MALSAAAHHSYDKVAAGEKYNAPRGQKTDRAEERELHDAPRRHKPPPPETRPASLAEPREDVEWVQLHIVDQMVDAPLLPTFDVPVPLMVEQLLLGVLSPVDSHVPEQVVEVPKIVCPPRCSHSPLCTADGETAGGIAYCRVLFFLAADYGAALRHSSSFSP